MPKNQRFFTIIYNIKFAAMATNCKQKALSIKNEKKILGQTMRNAYCLTFLNLKSMERRIIKTLWTKNELEKVFRAVGCYNKTFEDKLIVEDFKKEDDLTIWITISYENEDALIWFGIFLGRAGA